ncbi:MAG: hypothetical protein FJ011_26290 [Chloroflexi bacterium]|nr:hypothetical protein [Chloroflexota bacterium]
MDNSPTVVPISATIRADQRERLLSYTKRSGAISISEALRELLDKVLPPWPSDAQIIEIQEQPA